MRIHKILLLILILVTTLGFSQNNSKWTDHLSYRKTFDLSIWGTKIIVASEFGVFIYDNADNSIDKISKINGLLGERITAIKALENVDAFVIGYETGDFSIVYSDRRIFHVNDIKSSGVSGDKIIHSIAEYGDKIYLGTTFGIVEYNIVKEEFGDTFYFGENGGYIQVNDITFLDNYIFTATNKGVYKADIKNPYLVDYNQWKLQNIGANPQSKFNSLAEINGIIIANNSETVTEQFILKNSVWSLKDQYPNVIKIKSNNEYIIYSAGDHVYIFNKDLELDQSLYKFFLNASSAIKTNDITWFASSETGLIKNIGGNDFSDKVPQGPHNNYPFRLKKKKKKLYVLYGYYGNTYAPKNREVGYDVLNTQDWEYIKPLIFDNVRDLVDVAIDPSDTDHVYMSSWGKGILEMQNNEKVEMWVEENTNYNIQKLFFAPDPNYVSIRIGGSIFDKDGNLWVANGWGVDKPFVVRKKNGDWDSFSFIKNSGSDGGMEGITIDKNGNKWIGTRDRGIWIYNEGDSFDSTGDDKMLRISTSENSGNLPSSRVNTIAIDKDNNAWIGTKLGLVVFSGIDDMFEANYFAAEPIIINENGVGKKLLGNQTINKIVVDGANNKWFATESGGVYYISSNGQKTIHHFTQENSPLLSNQVLDLDIDPETGRVYFITSKGLVSFIGVATEGGDNFSKVFAYPNPVIPGYDGDIFIKGLTNKTNVKITDINGNLIFETTSKGGQAVWNGYSLSGYKASSGVYLVFAVSKDGTDATVTKILIVN